MTPRKLGDSDIYLPDNSILYQFPIETYQHPDVAFFFQFIYPFVHSFYMEKAVMYCETYNKFQGRSNNFQNQNLKFNGLGPRFNYFLEISEVLGVEECFLSFFLFFSSFLWCFPLFDLFFLFSFSDIFVSFVLKYPLQWNWMNETFSFFFLIDPSMSRTSVNGGIKGKKKPKPNTNPHPQTMEASSERMHWT